MFRLIKRIFFFLLKAAFVIALPFIVLIRGAVFLHESYGYFSWISLAGGVLMSTLLLGMYIFFVKRYFRGKFGGLDSLKSSYWVALVLLMVYCIPALFFLSAANAKHPEVKKEFTKLHPILRLAISTVIFVDNSLVITDANRVPEDYRKMGLKTKSHSLHYRQNDGYAHAVDIRVKGRSWLRNKLLPLYFKIMGFKTLRHFGTEDHLHVSLMSHDRPGGI